MGTGVGGGGTYNSSDNLNALWGIGDSWRGFQLFWHLKCRGGGGGGGGKGGRYFQLFWQLKCTGGIGGKGGGGGVAFNSFDNLNALWEIGGGRVVVVEGLSSLLTA